jgi:hypothetical protein
VARGHCSWRGWHSTPVADLATSLAGSVESYPSGRDGSVDSEQHARYSGGNANAAYNKVGDTAGRVDLADPTGR